MATSTFDKTFIVTDPAAKERVIKVVSSEEKAAPIKTPPYTQEERNRSEALLKQYLSRSKS